MRRRRCYPVLLISTQRPLHPKEERSLLGAGNDFCAHPAWARDAVYEHGMIVCFWTTAHLYVSWRITWNSLRCAPSSPWVHQVVHLCWARRHWGRCALLTDLRQYYMPITAFLTAICTFLGTGLRTILREMRRTSVLRAGHFYPFDGSSSYYKKLEHSFRFSSLSTLSSPRRLRTSPRPLSGLRRA